LDNKTSEKKDEEGQKEKKKSKINIPKKSNPKLRDILSEEVTILFKKKKSHKNKSEKEI
jgi:hypothetical protein